MFRFLRLWAATALAAFVLSGCATGYVLDNQVQSFSQLPAMPAAPTYRFERTLSQQADPAQQALEALADPALHQAGFPARLRAGGNGQPARWRLRLATTQPEQVRSRLPGASAIPCTVLDRLGDGT